MIVKIPAILTVNESKCDKKMCKFIFTTLLILLSNVAHATTIEKGGDGKPLPHNAMIPPMVPIIDAVDTRGLLTPDPALIANENSTTTTL